MKRLPIISLLFLIYSSSSLLGDLRTFTSSDGRTLEGEILSVDSTQTNIKLKLSDNRVFDIPIDRFQNLDQEYIQNWIKVEGVMVKYDSRIEVEVATNRKQEKLYDQYWDDRYEYVTPTVTVKNLELDKDFEGIKGKIMLVAEGVRNNDFVKIMVNESFTIDVKRRSEASWTGKTGKAFHEIDSYARRGYKYRGYVLVLYNSKGETVYMKSSRPKWTTDRKRISLLKTGSVYDEEFTALQSHDPN